MIVELLFILILILWLGPQAVFAGFIGAAVVGIFCHVFLDRPAKARRYNGPS